MPPRACRLLMLAVALAPACAHGQWRPDLGASFLYDDNLSRAQVSADIVSDFAAAARAGIGRAFDAGERGDFTLAFDVSAVRYFRFEGASVASLGVSAGYRRKLGLGLTAPRVSAEAWLAEESSPEAVRDGSRGGASATLSKRFDERLEGSLGFAYEKRVQRHDAPVVPGIAGDPFSLQSRTLLAKGSYALGSRSALLASAAAREGDVVSSTRRNAQIFAESAAIALDPAFGPDYIAYRLSGARTISIGAGIAYDLSRRASLEAAVTAYDTRAHGGLDYSERVVSVSYLYRP